MNGVTEKIEQISKEVSNLAAVSRRRVSKESAFGFILKITAALVVNADGIIEWSTPAANALFGYLENELNMKPLSTLVPPELRERHDEHFSGFVKNPVARIMGDATTVLPGIKKDGTSISVMISLFPVIEENTGDAYVIAKIWRS